METLTMTRQASGEESMESPNSPRLEKKARQVKSKVKRMLINCFYIKGIVHKKNSSWQAKQSIPRTTVTFYDDCVEMCEDFTSNFDYKRTGCSMTTTHHLTLSFSPGNF
jgi:hypothetical protein